MGEWITTLTERGQASVPAKLRKELNLQPGDQILWEKISGDECRVLFKKHKEASGPLAMLGFGRTFWPGRKRSTRNWLKELRSGESD